MRVTFVFPGSSRFPVGGYKVAFEYANLLTQRGHAVAVVLPAHLDESAAWTEKRYHDARFVLWGITGMFGPQKWFSLHPKVRLKWVRTLQEANIPDADAIVATGWPTAEYIARYSSAKGRKYYLLQHYETWWGPEARVRATWKLPLHKLVIARWLGDLASELDQQSTYVPNGLDFQAFGCDRLIADRREPAALMLYHKFDWKGSADGIQALKSAKARVPGLTATIFGVGPGPENLPKWIQYVRNPPQTQLRGLYNQAAVFMSPSWAEGWPLPPAEAMMCGAALLCTDIGGHREYAIHERNALMTPPRNPELLCEGLIRMFEDNALRTSLAETALSDIHRFTWEAAADRFEAALLKSD